MPTQQGLRQASFRAIHGLEGDRPHDEDVMLAIATELGLAEVPLPETFDGMLIAWLQVRLESTDQNLPGLMAAFAQANGADNWSSLGIFGPAGE